MLVPLVEQVGRALGPTERGAGSERGAEPDALKGGVLGAVHVRYTRVGGDDDPVVRAKE